MILSPIILTSAEKKKDAEERYRLIKKEVWLKKVAERSVKLKKIIFFIIVAEILGEMEVAVIAEKMSGRHSKIY